MSTAPTLPPAEAWLIEYTANGLPIKWVAGHNAVPDWRDKFPDATSRPLIDEGLAAPTHQP